MISMAYATLLHGVNGVPRKVREFERKLCLPQQTIVGLMQVSHKRADLIYQSSSCQQMCQGIIGVR